MEAIRRKQAIKQGLKNNVDGVVNMSVLWLAPQCAFAGLIGAFGSIGQIEFYYAVLPKTMSGSLPSSRCCKHRKYSDCQASQSDYM